MPDKEDESVQGLTSPSIGNAAKSSLILKYYQDLFMKLNTRILPFAFILFMSASFCHAGDTNRALLAAIKTRDISALNSLLATEQYVSDIKVVKEAVKSVNPDIYQSVRNKYIGDSSADSCDLINALLGANGEFKKRNDRAGYKQMINDKLSILDDILLRVKGSSGCSRDANNVTSTLSSEEMRRFGYFPIYKKIFESSVKFSCIGDPTFSCRIKEEIKFSTNEERIINFALLSVVERIKTKSGNDNHMYSNKEYEDETLDYIQFLFESPNFRGINNSEISNKIGSIFVDVFDGIERKRQKDYQQSIPEVYRVLAKAGFSFTTQNITKLTDKKTEIEKIAQNSHADADDQWRVQFLNQILGAVTNRQPDTGAEIVQEKINKQLREACRGLANNPADAKIKLLFLLGKGGDPSSQCMEAGQETVTMEIIKAGDMELVQGLVSLQRDKMSLYSSGNEGNRYSFVEFAIENNKEDTAIFLVDSDFKIIHDMDYLLATSAKKKFGGLARSLITHGASPERALVQLLGDDQSAEVVLNASGEKIESLRQYYREEQRKAAEAQARLIAVAAAAYEARQQKIAKHKAEEQERYERLASQPKSIGERICMNGKIMGLFKVTVSGFVEGISDTAINIRIADTEHQSIRYNDTDLSQGVIIWDDHRNWVNCSGL